MLKLFAAAAAVSLVAAGSAAYAAPAEAASPVIEAMKHNVGGIQHIGIPTRNMQATTEFYTGLGFKILDTRQNGKSTVRFFKRKNAMLEVWESEEATGKAGAINHIALDTKNADALYPVIVMFLPFWKHGIKYFNIKGPNDEIIEFCEKVK